MKWIITALLLIGITSCKPEPKYAGDGVLTLGHSFLGKPVCVIKMPPVDISRPHIETYNLSGIPPSESDYRVTLVVPSSGEITQADRKLWGVCSFKIRANQAERIIVSSEFYYMHNSVYGSAPRYFNGLYTGDNRFAAVDGQGRLELIFECPGFASSEPVWAYVEIQSGGE